MKKQELESILSQIIREELSKIKKSDWKKKLSPLKSHETDGIDEGYGMGDMENDSKKAHKNSRWTVKFNESVTRPLYKSKGSCSKEKIKNMIREFLRK